MSVFNSSNLSLSVAANQLSSKDGDYRIVIEYSLNAKKWEVIRSFSDFKELAIQLISHCSSVPLLPPNNIFSLSKAEQETRTRLLDEFMKTCVFSQEIMNSFEFRDFIELDRNVSFTISRWETKEVLGGFEFGIVDVEVEVSEQVLFILTADDNFYSSISQKIEGLFGSFSSVFGKKKKEKEEGEPVLIRGELIIASFADSPSVTVKRQVSLKLDKTPSVLHWQASLFLLLVGFQDGSIECYHLQKENEPSTLTLSLCDFVKVHSDWVTCIQSDPLACKLPISLFHHFSSI